MKKKIQKERTLAVQRYFAGEDPEGICASFGKTKRWLYKWVSRHTSDDPAWFEDQSRRPISSPNRTPAEIEKIVEMVRLNLYNKDLRPLHNLLAIFDFCLSVRSIICLLFSSNIKITD